MQRAACLAFLIVATVAAAPQQQPVPQPFPRPGQPRPPAPAVPPPPAKPTTPVPAQPTTTEPPTEATLGVGLYPGAQFIASYDAGRSQRYYLFGASASFAELVAFYRTLLKQKGEVIFDAPATHIFEFGRYREETMAFPPSVVIKDYTWGGSEGYPNPKPGAQPARFRTVVQIVPAPPGAPK